MTEPESMTYGKKPPAAGRNLKCPRCGRNYEYPKPDRPPVRCSCGWWYRNAGGRIFEKFNAPF
jgi:uncharacterized C2H2 Zn-finger protein